MDEKSISIDSLELSCRSLNALKKEKILTIEDLLEQTEESLSKIRNLGSKSIAEILFKIEEYKKILATDDFSKTSIKPEKKIENFDDWIAGEKGKDFVLQWSKDKNIDSLEDLSAKAYNLLAFSNYEELSMVLLCSYDELMKIPHMDSISAKEIVRSCKDYIQSNHKVILEAYASANKAPITSIVGVRRISRYRNVILKFVKANDKDIRKLGLPTRAVNCLISQDLKKMSDIIFITENELLNIQSMGKNSVIAIMTVIDNYLTNNESRLLALCNGDESAYIDDAYIRDMILKMYQEIKFGGITYSEIEQRFQKIGDITQERLKKVIGSLIANNELEYVDFRLYRVYRRFVDCLEDCESIDERGKDCIRKRLLGFTLQEIADNYDLTRERVRQVVCKDVKKLRDWYVLKTDTELFDEDYYQYFYKTYAFDKNDAMEWLGMSSEIFKYLDMIDVEPGKRELSLALDDTQYLDVGLRLKIKNYLNRNKIFVDGMWVDKKRADLEELVVRKFCKDDVTFDDFVEIYNNFLKNEDIPYSEDLYCTPAVYHSRKNRLCQAKFLLWKLNEKIRYYDIEGRDFEELINVLNLDTYENIELSTLKFIEDYPEIMKKFDIRDQYELHNLLRKLDLEGHFHDFKYGRMPEIKFGTFNRDNAILDILIDNAPISIEELCKIIHAEYGYDIDVIQANYLDSFKDYYHHGRYVIDQKVMSQDNMDTLKLALPDDFYYINEIRNKYCELFPDADVDEINSYNLKRMGFTVFSRCVLKKYSSLEAFCEDLLTKEDNLDLTDYKQRFGHMQVFSTKLSELKKELRIVEYEKNQIIQFKKLEQFGVTKEKVIAFCDEVYDFICDNSYFSLQFIRKKGFDSELFELGFDDWFYSNLLISDKRFSFGMMFGNIILYKGNESISIKSMEMNLIRQYGIIDTYDLMNELNNNYGCKITDRMDIVRKVQGTEIYYDKILDRLYANADMYYRELDEAGE